MKLSDDAVDQPTMDEAVAVFAAVEAFGRKLHPRKRRMASDLPGLLRELAESVGRVRAVTGERDDDDETAG